jgi:copper homeostasis protein
MTRNLGLEVCVDTTEGLEIAARHGADRIELCASLNVGGLTPSTGMMRLASTYAGPIRVMIRPRQGDFIYSEAEVGMMLHDIDSVAGFGLDGVVIGANRLNGELDGDLLDRLISHAKAAHLKVTLHRAFDVTPDIHAGLAIAKALGVDSILTSGGATDALKGADTILSLVESAAGSIELIAGVGLTTKNVRELITRSGVSWVHGSCSLPRSVKSPSSERLGYSAEHYRRTDAAAITRLRAILHDIAHAAAPS